MQSQPVCRILTAREELFDSLSQKMVRPTDLVGTLPANNETEKGILAMIKTFQFMNEAIKNPKHPFRKTDSQPRKAQKNRYERRKVKEYLHLGDWTQEEMA